MREYIFNLMIGYYSFWILSFIFFLFLAYTKSKEINLGLYNFLLIFWVPFSLLFLGLRDSSIGTDSENYKYMYNLAVEGYKYEYFDNIEFLFFILLKITSYFGSYKLFFFSVHLIFLSTFLFFLSKVSYQFALTFILFLSFFFYYNLSINIIRNSLSIPFWLLGIFYLNLNKLKKGLSLFLISFLFHKTAIFIFLSYILIKFISFNKLVLIWIITSVFSFFQKDLLLYLLDFTPLSEYLELVQYVKYINYKEEFDYVIGFRLDFWLINFVMIVYIYINRFIGRKTKWDSLFVTLSILSVFSYQFPYSDRTSLFSWFLIPIIISITELNVDKSKYSNIKILKFLILSLFLSFPSFYLLIKNV
ncbi:EpsG family protein [Lacihabitans sp. LS3-19]|uniref:EpsG family protein n=1 Tax=Lacihabitans sp. LS3-19 TaxID=2487335 RepID=UPI0020CBF6BD|nr:EpsG family protein [Lacihabitans sp. LS3-19]MCP9769392.1 EpsG family protein [Lacihabitans sp. LS3-19]